MVDSNESFRFLSEAWLAEMVARSTDPGPDAVTVQQHVALAGSGADTGERLSYWLMIGPEGVSVATGLAESPTVTFEASEAVAAQIHSGTRTALNAFMDGDLTLTGDVGALSTVAKLLGDNDPFADLARKTTYS